jgi:hypothetical protein
VQRIASTTAFMFGLMAAAFNLDFIANDLIIARRKTERLG